MNVKKRSEVILVVDDSADALSMINDTLEAAGFNVLVALEGRQALTIAQRIQPDMILLDAVMPVMNGFDTCRAMRDIPALSNVPIMFMTGLTDSANIIEGLEAGGVDYLAKPINPNELIARMNVHLNNARFTNRVQSALDCTGQFLFSVDAQGKITWATPQTSDLFEKVQMTEIWRDTELAGQIIHWLANPACRSANLKLSGLDTGLSVVFVNSISTDETLLKLLEEKNSCSEDLLRSELELTARESQVLLWISNGKTNREIAQILDMSPRTVNKHLEQIFPKLGVENRTTAARVALQVIAQN